MSNLAQLADINDGCNGLLPIVKIIRNGLYPIVRILIPIILIVYGIIDLGKGVIASDEKEIKAAQSRLIKRCIYAVLIFFVTTLVSVVMNLVATGIDDDDEANSWFKCWEAAK